MKPNCQPVLLSFTAAMPYGQLSYTGKTLAAKVFAAEVFVAEKLMAEVPYARFSSVS